MGILLSLGLSGGRSAVGQRPETDRQASRSASGVLRIATFNVSLFRQRAGQLATELGSPASPQATAIAELISLVRPDVLLLNEVDFDQSLAAGRGLQDNYLAHPVRGEPIRFPYSFAAPVNTGVPSGLDLDRDGQTDGPGDSLGYGEYPGQYGMLVLSRLPIETAAVRTFRRFRWRDMPGALLPVEPASGQPYYDPHALEILPLSSKSHWDIPVRWGTVVLHLLVSHPTPPVFDGPEDRNGRRNHDEIRLWADYLDAARSGYLVDDRGVAGGLAAGSYFVIAGDLNADPHDGASYPGAIRQLLEHPLVQAGVAPVSVGAVAAAREQGEANRHHHGDPAQDTADFADEESGNLRADYLLPSRTLRIVDSGVLWPVAGEPGHEAAELASDHHLVWIDIERPPVAEGAVREGAAEP